MNSDTKIMVKIIACRGREFEDNINTWIHSMNGMNGKRMEIIDIKYSTTSGAQVLHSALILYKLYLTNLLK